MSYFLARVFDKEAFIGRTIKNLDDNIKVFLIKNKKIFILTYLFLFIKVDPKWRINMKGVLRFYIDRVLRVLREFDYNEMEDDKSNKKKAKHLDDMASIASQWIQSASPLLGIAKFVPLINEFGAIFDEIIDIVEAAEHNKRTCGVLLKRVHVANSVVRQFREKKDDPVFFNKENYLSLQRLTVIIGQIKIFVSEISQLKTLKKYIGAKNIEKTFADLCKEFDSSFNFLLVSIDLNRSKSIEDKLEEFKADQDYFAELLREMVKDVRDRIQSSSTVLGDIAPVLVPFTKFVPLIKEIGAIVDEIFDVVEAAEHNKRTCIVLLERVRVADSAIRQFRGKKDDPVFFNNENYLFLQELSYIITQIKKFVSEISQLKTLTNYIEAKNIEKTFADLCKEFDSSFNFLLVSIDLKRSKSIEDKLEELKANQYELMKIALENLMADSSQNQKKIENIFQDYLLTIYLFKNQEWIKKKLEKEDISYFEYNEFSKPIPISKGGFGIVYKAETNDKKPVALKSLIGSVIDENIIKNFVKELKLLRMVSYHDNINRFLGITKDNTGYVMVLEYANEGNLKEYLEKKFDSLQWENKIQMALDITCGLLCLHLRNIIHRDLHSKNILVNDGKLLIADFGLSKQLTEVTSNSTSNRMGIIEYVEPQCIKCVNYVKDKRSDVYSLGVLLWEITSGRPPFCTVERDMLGYHISHENLREEPIEGTPLEYQQLYQKCWDGDPEKRPKINQIYKEILSQSNVNDISEQSEDSLVNNDSFDNLNIQSCQSDLCIKTELVI
ncbi:kinase-like protein [Rhizophagus irregularis]|nr:kinase-like protein [Rhizophagus irregularis]